SIQRVGKKNGPRGPRWNGFRGSRRPCGSCSVPQPRIAETREAVSATKQYQFLNLAVISHHCGSASRRGDLSLNLRPGSAVEAVGVVKIGLTIDAAENYDFLADRIIGRSERLARRKPLCRRQFGPGQAGCVG